MKFITIMTVTSYVTIFRALIYFLSVMAKRVMEKHPLLARQENENNNTPMHLAAIEDKLDVFTVLLEQDRSLGYLISTVGAAPLLCIAASQGHVGIARELLKQCPDAPYSDADGSTCLHIALLYERAEFAEFVLGSQQLQHLINMANNRGETPLHLLARKYMTNILAGNQVNVLPPSVRTYCLILIIFSLC